MEEPEKNGQEGSPEKSPLAVKQPKVTRFSRKAVYVMVAVAIAVFTVSLAVGLTPKKKAQGQETAENKKNPLTPNLPDPLVTAPGKYNELQEQGKGVYATAQRGTGHSPGPAAGGSGGASPYSSQDPRAKEEDLLQKNQAGAISSPLTFQQDGGGGGGPRPEAPTPPVMPQMVVPSLQNLTDRLNPPSDDQNMQEEKRNFSGKRESELPYLKTTLIPPLSEYEVKAGTILPALLLTGINSDLPGQLTAQIRENVYDTVTGNFLLIPQGTRIIGEYDSKVAFGQERVLVVWTRLILPNGHSISLEGMPGTDLSGYAGVTGKVNNHYGKLITGVVLGSIIGAGAQVAVGGVGAPNVPATFGQMATSGAAQNINQVGQQHTQKVLNMQPTIEIAPGDKINVFVTKDMILKPYSE